MAKRERPSVERLRELLEYNPETGELRWRVIRGRAKAEVAAGRVNDRGYRLLSVDGHTYRAHRVAWAMYYGVWPDDSVDIDHKDMDRDNNRICNLRTATRSLNNANSPAQRNNTSGYKGVHFHSQIKRWRARIKYEGRHISLGCYDTPEEAHAAYCKAARELHGDFARVA